REIFLEEEKKFGEESPYRIGIWRALALAAMTDEDREEWISKIIEVYQNPDNEDRIHAAESMAKLGVSPYTVDPEMTQTILNKDTGVLQVFTLWGTHYTSSDMNIETSPKTTLLNILA